MFCRQGKAVNGPGLAAGLWVVCAGACCHGAPNQVPVSNVGDTFRTLMLGWQDAVSRVRSFEGYVSTLTFRSPPDELVPAARAGLQFYAWAETPTGPAWVQESRWARAGEAVFSPPGGLSAYREGVLAVSLDPRKKGDWVLRPQPDTRKGQTSRKPR